MEGRSQFSMTHVKDFIISSMPHYVGVLEATQTGDMIARLSEVWLFKLLDTLRVSVRV
jgi:hypothetical protein